MRPIVQSRKLQHVRYDVRGPILAEAHRLEAEGHKILKLNIGNPAPFGFEAPEAIVADIVHNLPESQGYSDSRGIYSARTAVAQYYQARGLPDTVVDDVYIGNGVSELITMTLQAFLDDGNEILVPAPDYPLWTGAVTLSGGTPVHYRCDEDNDWNPDLADIPVRLLSTGQRRRAAIARVVASGAPLWLLDEPANGLDAAALGLLETAIATHRASGGAVLVASHTPIKLPAAIPIDLSQHLPQLERAV